MTIERPELRIIDAELWTAVRARLGAIHRKYTKTSAETIPSPRRCSYLLSGILVCDDCGFPLTIYGGRQRFYRCSTAHTKGMCKNDLRVREQILRDVALDAVRKQLQGAEQIARVRKEIAQRLRDYSQTLDTELRDRRDRLKRTEDRIKGLVHLHRGRRSLRVHRDHLRDLETQAKTERAGIEGLQREAQEPVWCQNSIDRN